MWIWPLTSSDSSFFVVLLLFQYEVHTVVPPVSGVWILRETGYPVIQNPDIKFSGTEAGCPNIESYRKSRYWVSRYIKHSIIHALISGLKISRYWSSPDFKCPDIETWNFTFQNLDIQKPGYHCINETHSEYAIVD